MHWVLNVSMGAEFTLHVFVAQDSHLIRKEFPMGSKESAVKRNRWEEGQWRWFESLSSADSGRIGQPSGGEPHSWLLP